MDVHLVDGTYELFRHFYAVPSVIDRDGREAGAVRAVLWSVLRMIDRNVTHLGVATDHVVESFRNGLWPGYKTGDAIDPRLRSQFPLLEQALSGMGVRVWPMVELEADDALASAAARAASDPRVGRVFICTPDKDLAQCVVDERVVQIDRRSSQMWNAAGVMARFGVPPASIPDYLALVGDSADGYPGLPGWGRKSAATVLARYAHLEGIPREAGAWDVPVRSRDRLAATLVEYRELALLFRTLATLRTDAEVFGSVDELRWMAPGDDFSPICRRLEMPGFERRVLAQAARRR